LAPTNYIDRPPRIQPELPHGEYTIPNPPEKEENPGQLMGQALLPVITIMGYIVVSLLGKGRSMLMMIPMGLSVVASIVLAIYTNRAEKKMKEEKDAVYGRRLVELRRDMESNHEKQRVFYSYNYPNPEKTLAIANDLNLESNEKKEDIRSGTRLWERRPTDQDFCSVRLGIGTLPSTVIYKLPENENYDSPLIRDAVRLSEDSRFVNNVAVVIPLRTPTETAEKEEDKEKKKEIAPFQAIRHSVGIAGTDINRVYDYIRTLLIDFTTYHSPVDTMIYVAGSYNARHQWRWAFSLPHCKESNKNETLCFEEQERKNEKEPDRLRNFWKNLRTMLERRKMRLVDNDKGGDVTLPFILVVVDVLSEVPEWSSLKDLEAEAAISTILLEGPLLGAGIIFLVPTRNKIPSRCQAVLEVELDTHEENSTVFRYAEIGFNSYRFIGKIRLIANQDLAKNFAKALESLEVRSGYGSNLATTVTMQDLLKVTTIEEMQKLALDNWLISKDRDLADWLQASVGLLSGNEPRTLIFSAQGDGNHGLVAGSTGSGKSELLMTLILSMAMNYSPDVLNFVLIDYKGGSAFDPFKKLPHQVDIVTNLDQSASARVFASINAEMERRQRILSETKLKNIIEYRRKGLNLVKDTPPFPHLFIIIDEFAEMISTSSEFKAQLESIVRLGRSLGISLILAAQRPIGVTDQMRANIKFRICLRVETPDDSRELLRRSDAAFLPPGIPGRGYLQVGNENIELIQTAYTGTDYRGPQDQKAIQNVIWLDRPKKSTQKSAEPPKLYDVMVEMMDNLSRQESKPQWRPWPEFLPDQAKRILTLETPLDVAYMSETFQDWMKGSDTESISGLALNEAVRLLEGDHFSWKGIDWQEALQPIVGLIDNPYRACQAPLRINFPSGHLVVFGASGRGKTMFLRTMIYSLAVTHSPDELQIYILDFGGRGMSVFKDMPHVGGIINADEEERVERVLVKVEDILDDRQKLFSDVGASSLISYNVAHPEKPLPAVVVVIDNFAEFKEYYENLMGPLVSLVREARAFGVHFAISADTPNSLTNKLFNLITERVTLKLSDTSEYSTVVGRGVPADLSNVPGRGYIKVDGYPAEFRVSVPLEFQTALPFHVESGTDITEKLSAKCRRMAEIWNNAWKGARPAPIETLSIRVLLKNVIDLKLDKPSKRLQAVVGIDDRTLSPLVIDLEKQGPHLMIVGAPLSGKTTALRTMLLSLAFNFSTEAFMVVLIDFQKKFFVYGGTRTLAELPQVVDTVFEFGQLDNLLANLKVECEDFEKNSRRRKILLMIDNYDSFTEEGNRKNPTFFDELTILARKYQTAGLYLLAAGSIQMTRATEDVRKIIAMTNFGIALKDGEAVNGLNGKFPRSLQEVDLPMGRAFTVKSGKTAMLQVATPSPDDNEPEKGLDDWVENIQKRHSQDQVKWMRVPEAEEKNKKKSIADNYDIEDIKKKLIENGMPEDLLELLGPEDIVLNAAEMGIINKDEMKA